MARTITAGKLLSSIESSSPRIKEEQYAAEFVTQLINTVWMAQDFRETLAPLPPFYLVGGKMEYGPPLYTIPKDFMGLRSADMVTCQDGNQIQKKALKIKTKQVDFRYGEPDIISYEPSKVSFVIFPVLPANTSSGVYFIEGVYKTLPKTDLITDSGSKPILASEITRENYSKVLLPLDDRHYGVMQRVLKALVKTPANLNEEIATNQLVKQLLQEVAIQEGMEIGSSPIAPAEPLFNVGSFARYF